MGDIGVPIVIVSRLDENLAAVNAILRESGHPVHAIRVEQLNELEELVLESKPEMLILFDEERLCDIPSLIGILEKSRPAPPLIIARSDINEQSIADAMNSGAKDVVSMTHRNRFQAVIDRELAAHRMELALASVLSSASQYKQEMRTLMDGTAEAIADIQEGIVVAANTAWLSLYGFDDESAAVGTPFMDLHREADQATLKGALVACLKGKWDGSLLQIMARQTDGVELPLEFALERVTVEGEPAVRAIVPGEADPSTENLIERAIYQDPATGFYHRYHFIDRLEERLQQPLSGGVRALIYIRPDRFASVHDEIGLIDSENILTRFAELLREFMQPADLYGRFGGTMFVVLVERGTMNDARSWANQICKAVENQLFEVNDRSASLTCSIGICEVPVDSDSLPTILCEAETACRKGRDAGGNRVELTQSSEESEDTRDRDAIWVPKIREALMNNRLRLIHQAVTSLNEDLDSVFDTQLRMLDEHDELVLPGEFLPAAERANLMKNVDRWVIGASFSFCAVKKPELVFVRLSRDSVSDNTLLDWLKARIGSANIDPAQICFQVSEEVAAQHLKRTKEVAEELRKANFKFAVDHLGTGRDPARIFQHIPMDFVKIDGSLMQGLRRDKSTQQQVADLVNMARDRNIKTIAERIEDANTIAVLFQMGISYIQGNYAQMRGVVLEDTQTARGLSSTSIQTAADLTLE